MFPATSCHSTMRRITTLSLLLVFSTLPATKARAGDLRAAIEGRAPTVSLGAFTGGHFFAEGTNLGVARGAQASQGARSNAAAGLRASFGLGRWFTAEAEVLGLATEDRTFQRKARILGYRFNALANLMAGDFRPFVMVGAGAIQVASTDAEGNAGLVRDTDGEVHAGVGFDYRLVDQLSVRGDARVVQMPSKQNWGLTTDVEATLGAVVTFGGGAVAPANQPVSGPAADALASLPVEVTPTESSVLASPVTSAPLSEVSRLQPAEDARSGDVVEDLEVVALAANVRTVSDLLDRAKEIKFDGTGSKIADASKPFLEELAAALVKEPGVRLEIVSHTGDSGDAKKDLALTKRRAEAVKYLLVGKGASADQVVATGRGSEDPIAPNITRSGRMRNERVELHRAPAR
jgi:outer membrane protein OmpA-like peptidoglycan-associated protein